MLRAFLILTACGLSAAIAAQPLPSALTDSDFHPVDLDEAKLGQLLFYDPILSGNREVACATCHHPDFGTSDGVALSIGDGGLGLGPKRRINPENPPEQRIPRNAPALFNLGAKEFSVLFHDGRLEVDPDQPNGLRSPMDADMVTGFASALSAQTMFPVLSRDEMAGSHKENRIGRAVRQGLITGTGGAWDLLARRVADLPAYAERFVAVYPHIDGPADIAFTDISNAIAKFMEHEWRSDTSPFDAALRGAQALQDDAKAGMDLFYGAAGCASCHSGPLLSDFRFHAMAVPQIGPGKAASFEFHQRDEGRFRVTGNPDDLYAFRTPSLRNVALTGPYGHAGAHSDLATFVADHADPAKALRRFDRTQVRLPKMDSPDFAVLNDPEQIDAIADAVSAPPVALSRQDVAALVAFLGALTDPIAIDGRLGIPDAVPSGLQVRGAARD